MDKFKIGDTARIKSVQERITEHLRVVGDLRLAAKAANDRLASAKAALRRAEDEAEQAYKSQCDGEKELRILVDEAVGIEWQQTYYRT